MKTKNIILTSIITFSVFLTSIKVNAQNVPVEIDGYVRNYTGVLLEDDHDFAIIQNTLNLQLSQQKDNVGFNVNPFLYHYPNRLLEFSFREAYLDLYTPKVDFRIGKQQIIWGQADGVFITDVVSPKDMSEFLLRDFEEIRMGVTAAKADFYIGESHRIEAVWIPSFQPTVGPDENSIFQIQPEFPLTPEFDYSKKEVSSTFENSELFMRYSLTLPSFDVQLMGGYTWDDDPALHTTPVIILTVTCKVPSQRDPKASYHFEILIHSI